MSDQQAIIIGIHGLLNKPEKGTLQGWWADALVEGLRANGVEISSVPFELAYWADVRNPAPIPLDELDEPYVPAAPGTIDRRDPKLLDRGREIVQDKFSRGFDKAKDLLGLGSHTEKLLGIKLGDLADYYAKEAIRRVMRDRLHQVLDRHPQQRILLIAHSMGSLIGYDVLRELESDPGRTISHLVTIGSPLGLPYVSAKIREEFGEARTPECVERWSNLSDPGDKVAIDCNLDDDYRANSASVSVDDVFVNNGYRSPEGEANNHKSYGYLRTPEMADRIAAFLDLT